jgi:hypothetical protein
MFAYEFERVTTPPPRPMLDDLVHPLGRKQASVPPFVTGLAAVDPGVAAIAGYWRGFTATSCGMGAGCAVAGMANEAGYVPAHL